MKITQAVFVCSATHPNHYPSAEYSELAFYGRSNSGKSSLINALLRRHHLVKTGSKPGMTRTINFFLVNQFFYVVDLPGFGYASVSKSTRENFRSMIRMYFEHRHNLRLLFLFIDLRRDPAQEELDVVDCWKKFNKPFVLVATKADKANQSQTIQGQRRIAKAFGIAPQHLFVTSSKTGLGLDALRVLIQNSILKDS